VCQRPNNGQMLANFCYALAQARVAQMNDTIFFIKALASSKAHK